MPYNNVVTNAGAATSNTNGQLVNANDSIQIALQLQSPIGPDNGGRFTIDGTYGTAVLIVEKCYSLSEFASNTWTTLTGVTRLDTSAQVNGNLAPSDNSTLDLLLPNLTGLYAVRLRLVSLGSGTVLAEGATVPQTGGLTLAIPITQTVASTAQAISSTSANAFAVGPAGTTNPSLNVDASTGSAATGLNIKSAAAAGGLAVSVISSGTNENLTVNAKGSGTITFQSVATGNIIIGDAINIQSNTTTGTKIGTATTQKLSLWNATPIIQPANTVDYLAGLVNAGLRASGGTAAAAFPGLISSSSASGGIGYATGAGGAVTQATGRTTGVTLNTICGAITLVSAAGSATPATFTVTNSSVAALDTVIASQKSGTDAYTATVSAVAAGSFKLTIVDLTGTTTEQPVINFAILKAVAS